MKDLEVQIIKLIHENKHISDELKKRYILALFLMDSDKLEEYLKLLQNFDTRCREVDAGIFIMNADEARQIRATFDDVKRDILSKIQQKNNNKQN